jgi:hypothetical protein
MTRRHSLVEALLGLAGLATLAFAFGAVAFALGLLIAEREKAARIEGMEASANALMREGYPVPACYLDTLIAEERAR